MGQMYLLQELSDLRGEFLQNILSGYATESDGRSLTRMGQVIEASWEVRIANKTASCGAGKV